jgi:lysozyme family protein
VGSKRGENAMTRDEAAALYESGFWKQMTQEEIAKFQIMEERLCMPFKVFHEAVMKTLGRPVFTHEFGLNRDGLIKNSFMGIPLRRWKK